MLQLESPSRPTIKKSTRVWADAARRMKWIMVHMAGNRLHLRYLSPPIPATRRRRHPPSRPPTPNLLTRCEGKRHTSRTKTLGKGPVLCYKACAAACHNHPKRVFCRNEAG